MIKSMTGFASLTRDEASATISVTIRAVNHRFLDVQLRAPSSLSAIEGRLRTLVQQHVARGRVEVSVAVQPRAGQAAQAGADAMRARLAERVKEIRADASADEAAVAQEIVRFANRSDVTEETVRFRAHLEHWRALSDSPEPCGRKLDFLLQEMNREINTLGSKAEGAGVSEIVVGLKAELEKMREQVQNVE